MSLFNRQPAAIADPEPDIKLKPDQASFCSCSSSAGDQAPLPISSPSISSNSACGHLQR
jgi:hypothetical protein